MWKWETDKRPKGVVLVIHDMMEHHDYYTGLIAQLRKDGYHVVTGDLPGHGQTTRMNKGHISDFAQYLDRVKEWHEVARAYRLPTFILGQGLGGLIAIETLRRNMVRADGLIVLNPLLAFKQSFINRKNTIRSSIRMGSDAHRFDPGLEPGYFTTDKKYLELYENDELLVRKVSHHWYRTVVNQMKDTSEYIDDMPDVPILAITSKENDIIEKSLTVKILKDINTSELTLLALDNIQHSVFQRDDITEPYHYLARFLDDQLFRIGML